MDSLVLHCLKLVISKQNWPNRLHLFKPILLYREQNNRFANGIVVLYVLMSIDKAYSGGTDMHSKPVEAYSVKVTLCTCAWAFSTRKPCAFVSCIYSMCLSVVVCPFLPHLVWPSSLSYTAAWIRPITVYTVSWPILLQAFHQALIKSHVPPLRLSSNPLRQILLSWPQPRQIVFILYTTPSPQRDKPIIMGQKHTIRFHPSIFWIFAAGSLSLNATRARRDDNAKYFMCSSLGNSVWSEQDLVFHRNMSNCGADCRSLRSSVFLSIFRFSAPK